MRLTLRTLLAFRDGVLSSQEHDDLNRRIQQNAPVANLLQQINDLVRSHELRTPKIDSSGPGDANVVAEYLDDALNSESIAELERLCLQNAEHLCELAHCHQLLAEATHTHVSVPESLQITALSLMDAQQREQVRRRLLTRSSRQKEPVVLSGEMASPIKSNDENEFTANANGAQSTTQTSALAPVVVSGAGTIRQAGLDLESSPLASEVPAYLLASQRKRWQIPVAILALISLLLILVWQSVGSLDSLKSMWKVSTASQETRQEDASKQSTQEPSKEDSIAAESTKIEERAGEVANNDANTVETESEPIESKSPSPESVTAENDSNVLSTEESELQPAVTDSNSSAEEESTAMEPDSSATPIPPVISPDPATTVEGPISGLAFVASKTDQSNAAILVSKEGGTLELLAERQPLKAGRVIIPPSVRTSLQFTSWTWNTGGPSIIEFKMEDHPSSGRALVEINSKLLRGKFTSSNANEILTLRTPLGTFEIKVSPSVFLAIEIASRQVIRGSISEPGIYEPALIIVALGDDQENQGRLAEVFAVDADQRFVFHESAQGIAAVGKSAPIEFRLQTPPRWYSKNSFRLIDQEASQDFLESLEQRQNSITEQIGTLASNDRPELAAIAIQTSLMLGNWRPLVSELLISDRLRAHWTPTLELAKQLAIGNESAQRIFKELLEEEMGADATRLFELFCGLSQQQQEASGLSDLLKGLESESLPMRVLSSFELTQLTGSDHSYQPHAPLKATIQQIRRFLNTEKLAIPPIPDPIWERTPKL